MSSTIDRVDRLQRHYRRLYPDALAVCGQLAQPSDASDTDPEWPSWCWLPMAAVAAYVVDRSPAAVADIAKVAALTAWRLGRGVYEPDDHVVATALGELYDSAGGGAQRWQSAVLPPLDTWTQLPEWCCYLQWPEHARLPDTAESVLHPLGTYVHLEFDHNTGRPELRLLLDTDGTWDGLVAIPVYLDRPTLGSALADAGANAAPALRGVTGADARSLAGPSGAAAAAGVAAWTVLPLVLTLIDPAARYTDPDAPTDQPQPARPRDGLWRPAPATRTWTIGYTSRPALRLVRP